MSKYLLLCTFSCREEDDEELFTNHWKVGEFNSLKECFTEGIKDLEQTARNGLEGRFDDDEQEEFEDEVKTYISGYELIHRTEEEFKLYEPVQILSNDYWTDYYREILDYIVIKVED